MRSNKLNHSKCSIDSVEYLKRLASVSVENLLTNLHKVARVARASVAFHFAKEVCGA